MKPAAAGFTLVEVLVALVIFAVVTAAGTAMAGFALRSTAALEVGSDAFRRLQLARAVMKADFGQAVVRPVRDAYGGVQRFGFSGDAPGSGSVFVALVRDGWNNIMEAEARGPLQYVEYVLDRGELKRRVRARLDMTPQTPVHEAALLTGVESLSVSFLSAGTWSREWRAGGVAGGALPEAVAFDLELAGIGSIRQVFMVAPL